MKLQRGAIPGPPGPQGADGLSDALREVASSRLLGGIEATSVRRLGSGSDHTALCINERSVLRCAKQTGSHTAQRSRHDVAVLDAMAERSPLCVPEVIDVDPDTGSVLVGLLEGTALLDVATPDLGHIAAPTGPVPDSCPTWRLRHDEPGFAR